MKKSEIDKIVSSNRSVNAEQLAEALKILRKLREAGVIDDSRSEITIPFAKRITARDCEPEKVLHFRGSR